MARSMTGYGIGRISENGINLTVELRSVNNRFLDLNIRLPRTLYQHEPDIRDICRKKIERGRMSISVVVEYTDDQTPDMHLDHARIKAFAKQLDEMRGELGIEEEIRLDHLLRIEDLFVPCEDKQFNEQLWKLSKEALIKAIDNLIESGTREAEILCKDISARLSHIDSLLNQIKVDAVQQVDEYHKRLLSRLEEIIEDNRIDRNRIETEIALAADKLDISEEIVRLDSHLKMFHTTLEQNGSIGKKLGFILQEMTREANTIASKSWALEISQAAIKIKELLEQIREQVQNIE